MLVLTIHMLNVISRITIKLSVILIFQSVIARGLLNSIADRQSYVPVFINFSAQTSSKRTQEMIEGKLEKRRKNVIGNKYFMLEVYLQYA